jgi:hypothetical protein
VSPVVVSSDLPIGAIVGAVVGAIVVAVLIVLLIVWYSHRQQKLFTKEKNDELRSINLRAMNTNMKY